MARHKEGRREGNPDGPESRATTASTTPDSTPQRQGHDHIACRLSRRRDRVDRVRFAVTDGGDVAAEEPDYIKRARRRRWAP